MVNKKLIIINILIIFVMTSFILISHAATNKSDRKELIYTINQYIKKAEILGRKDTKRVEYFKMASELSKALITYYPDDDKGYAYLAYSLGSITKEVPFYKKISVAKEIKKSIDKALAINNKNHLAWFVAGMFYRESSKIDGFQRKLAEKYLKNIIEGASFEKAIDCFKNAINLDKSNIQYRYELAKTYEDFGKTDMALAEYRKILSFQTKEKKDLIYQHKAQNQLKKSS
jgi:tetratricopeptide (TPR) repeat protein